MSRRASVNISTLTNRSCSLSTLRNQRLPLRHCHRGLHDYAVHSHSRTTRATNSTSRRPTSVLRMSDFVPPPVFTGDRGASSSSSTATTDSQAQTQSQSQQTRIVTHNQYQSSGLDTSDLLPSPLALFQKWFDLVSQPDSPTPVNEPEAMLLCTCGSASSSSSSASGTDFPLPSSRVVLLKSIHPKEGLTFYTNYTSRKAREIASNPYVSVTFYWRETSQSVRFLGKARKVAREESQEYFDSRPLGSRIGAWASPQSNAIESRQELEAKVKEAEERFGVPGAAGLGGAPAAGTDKSKQQTGHIPVPDHWGGYRIEPFEVEFWCGRPNRLHDRFRYTRSRDSTALAGDDKWDVQRLAP